MSGRWSGKGGSGVTQYYKGRERVPQAQERI